MKIWRQVLCRSHNWKAYHFRLLTTVADVQIKKAFSKKNCFSLLNLHIFDPAFLFKDWKKEITVLSSCGILIAASKIHDLHCPHTLLQMKLKFSQSVSVCICLIISLGLGYCFLSPCGLQLREKLHDLHCLHSLSQAILKLRQCGGTLPDAYSIISNWRHGFSAQDMMGLKCGQTCFVFLLSFSYSYI